MSEHSKLKMKIDWQERALAEGLDWVKSRGDPSEISEDMNKKFKEIDKLTEASYSMIEKRLTQT